MTLPEINNPIILIVDDEPESRGLLREMLFEEEYQIVEAKNGMEGLAQYQKYRPDVILMDAQMPMMDGFQATAALQDLPGGEATPVLIVTAHDSEEAIEQAFQAGATDYIPKPVRWSLLRHRVRRLVDRRRSEQALAVSEGQLQTVLNYAPVGMCGINLNGVVVFARGQILGAFTPLSEDVVGTSIFDLFEETSEVLRSVRLTLEGQNHTTTVIPPEHEKVLEYICSPVLGQTGNVSGALIVVADVTDRYWVQEMQREVEREKMRILREFILAASHDFRTPISVINTTLYLVERAKTPEKQQQYLGVLRSHIDRLWQLIEDMLTMSRLDLMRTLEFDLVDLNQIARNARTNYQDRIEEAGLELTLDVPDEPLKIMLAEEEMVRAVAKLVDNAIIYTPEGGTIEIRTAVDGDTVRLEISDTGTGISETDMARIFDRFYRADETRSLETGGTGLGLSIARKILELHDGRLEVSSVPHQGSTFSIVLPYRTGKKKNSF